MDSNCFQRQRARLLAYAATAYLVKTESGPGIIRAGQCHHWLDSLLPSPAEWYYISAANPASQILSNAGNRARHQQLLALLKARGIRHWPGLARADDRGWPDEHSVLVLASSTDARRIAHEEFGQLAMVTGKFGRPATITLLNSNWYATATALAAEGWPFACA